MAYVSDVEKNLKAAESMWLVKLIVKFVEWRRSRKAFVQTMRELNNLTDRDLNDIGITRFECAAIAREAARFAK